MTIARKIGEQFAADERAAKAANKGAERLITAAENCIACGADGEDAPEIMRALLRHNAELVAALRALVKDVEDYSRDEGYTEPDTLEQARAVLAKANA